MKKIIAMLLAVVMVFALCACGSQPAADNTPAEESKAPAEETPAASSAEGSVYYLNFKPEADEAWQKVAAAYPERKFYVVDTLAACMGEGLIVTYALEAQLQGKSIDEVRAFTEKIKMKTCHQFTVDDLMYLKRGGRISGGTALIGTILKIKPVMCADNRGKLVAVGKVIGRKASIKWLFNKYVEKAYDKKNQIVYIAHCDCADDAEALADMIREKSECKSITINYIDQVIGSHSGPGTLAIFFLGENREA